MTKKSDIQELVNAEWLLYKEIGKDKKGFTKEDALVAILELLDCNSLCFDLTKEEYDSLIAE
jgi:arsenate reductase-like glutaredoxin family protein